MAALLEAAASEADFPARIVGVISNVAGARGLDLAKDRGLATVVIDHKKFPSRDDFETSLDRQLTQWNVNIVCLAGFMRIISPHLIARWPDKIINIHPSRLPEYPGLRVHERVFLNNEELSGCTVHYVREKVDFGPGIVQAEVPIRDCRSPQEIADRVLVYEHLIYPLAVRLLCGGKIEVVNDLVLFKGQKRRSENMDGGYNPLIKISGDFSSQIERKDAGKRSLLDVMSARMKLVPHLGDPEYGDRLVV